MTGTSSAGADARPLTPLQTSMLLMATYAAGANTHIIQFGVQISGPVDVDRLVGAIQGLKRHPLLLARVDARCDPPCFVRRPPFPTFRCPVTDVVSDDDVAAIARREATTPFDLGTGPLIRFHLARASSNRSVLVVTAHHIVFDGRSAEIIVADLVRSYAGTAPAESAQPRTPATRRPPDPARVRAAFDGSRRRAAIPFDREDGTSFDGRSITSRVEGETWERILASAEAVGATPFAVLATVLGELLRRHGNGSDFLLGMPVATRTPAQADEVGCFVNMVPLRVRIGAADTLRDAVQRMTLSIFESLRARDLAHEELVRGEHGCRTGTANPFFATVIGAQNTPFVTQRVGSATFSPFELPDVVAEFPLYLDVIVDDDGATIKWQYQVRAYDDATIERALADFHWLLAGCTHSVDAPLEATPLEPAALDDPGESDGRSLIDAFLERVARDGGDVAIVGADGSTYTYDGLERWSRALARDLRARGVGIADRVAIAMPRSVAAVAASIAVLRVGATSVPVGAELVARDIEIIEHLGCSVVLVQRPPEVALDAHVVEVAEVPRPDDGAAPFDDGLRRSDVATCILHTSGSSGRPKGAEITDRSIVTLVADRRLVPLTRGTRVLYHSSLGFDISAYEIWGPLLTGGVCVIAPPGPLTVTSLRKAVSSGVDVLWLTASLFNLIVDEDPRALEGVEVVLTGGEPLSSAHVARLQAAVPTLTIINGYGPTESMVFASAYRIPPGWPADRPVPIGTPVGGRTARVGDPYGRPLPDGWIAELFLGGTGLALGYADEPALTADRFVPDPVRPGERLYRTGDLCRRRPDGLLEFHGRRDRQLKIRGFRVEPGEIESVLRAHPRVADARVTATSEARQSLVAYVVLDLRAARSATRGDDDDLRTWLRRRLPDHLVPSIYVELEAFPLNSNGKVDLAALPSPSAGVTRVAMVEPRTPLEQTLALAWRDVLNLDKVSVHDNFFELGGHSLLAIQLVDRLEAEVGPEVSLRAVLDHPSIAALAAHLNGPPA